MKGVDIMKSTVNFISSCVGFVVIGACMTFGKVIVTKAVDAYDFDPFKKRVAKSKVNSD